MLFKNRFPKVCVLVFASLLMISCGGGGSSGGSTTAGVTPSTTAEVINASYAIIVEIEVVGQVQYLTMGTGFAIAERRIATNAHVAQIFDPARRDAAEKGFRITGGYAIQSGTGTVFEITQALVHPNWNQSTSSPDVGILTTIKQLPSFVSLAASGTVNLMVGDDLALSGFPGDVQDIFTITPGVTVPQATTFSGPVTALRNFSTNVVVTTDNTDIIQHQMPTTGGTSGSAIIKNGFVVGIHNAGTVKFVVTPPNAPGGSLGIERVSAASNNFGIHVKYIHEMIDLFDANAIVGLPVPAFGTQFTGTYSGGSSDANTAHEIVLTVDEQNDILGVSNWPGTGQFLLTGSIDSSGNVILVDDASVRMTGFNTGIYTGTGAVSAGTASISGNYSETDSAGQNSGPLGNFSVSEVLDSQIIPQISGI